MSDFSGLFTPLLTGAVAARIGVNQGNQIAAQRQSRLAEALAEHMQKQRLEKRQADKDLQAQANFGVTSAETARHHKADEGKKTSGEQISARVRELVAGGVPLLKASSQARLEFGETNPMLYGSPEYVQGAMNVTRAREAEKLKMRGQRGTGAHVPTMNPSSRETYFNKIADRAVAAAGGDVNKAGELLVQSPETANVFSEGMNGSHMNAARARYQMKGIGRAAEILSNRRSSTAPASIGVLSDLATGTPAPRAQNTGASQQQRDWDEAAGALRTQGNRTPATVLGPRPAR